MIALLLHTHPSPNNYDHIEEPIETACAFSEGHHNPDYCEAMHAKQEVIPASHDILCGPGGHARRNKGNQMFFQVLRKHHRVYARTMTKQQKTGISKLIFNDIISRGSRFLKKDPIFERWYLASNKAARDKISHALRRMNREGDEVSTTELLPPLCSTSNEDKAVYADPEVEVIAAPTVVLPVDERHTATADLALSSPSCCNLKQLLAQPCQNPPEVRSSQHSDSVKHNYLEIQMLRASVLLDRQRDLLSKQATMTPQPHPLDNGAQSLGCGEQDMLAYPVFSQEINRKLTSMSQTAFGISSTERDSRSVRTPVQDDPLPFLNTCDEEPSFSSIQTLCASRHSGFQICDTLSPTFDFDAAVFLPPLGLDEGSVASLPSYTYNL